MGAAAPSLTPLQRIERRAVRCLTSLPAGLQVRLSRRPPVSVGDVTLDPGMQLLLALIELRREPEPGSLSPERLRRLRRGQALMSGGAPTAVASVGELQIDAGVPLRARHYRPTDSAAARALILYFHGGGFVFGDLDTHDSLCRLLCSHSGAQVVAVDYRLSPEHPFPAAIEDARGALRWAQLNAGALGADPGRIGGGGDSAGGSLAAVVSQLAARDGGSAPALQLLMYPGTDMVAGRPSRQHFEEGFFLTGADIAWFLEQYVGASGAALDDPRISPLRADDLTGLAPALVVTAGFDPLRDEGEAYAGALEAAGVPVTQMRFGGLIHGFV
ncbi:MAG: alpha/beta hydrolase, partial [Acidobacteriota bacterium]|nr:alpha/beta hydrolase [Acidobacteriota bacterium]